jgi:hypothetical protein
VPVTFRPSVVLYFARAVKRILVATLTIGLLSACAGVSAPAAAKSENPGQSLATTGKAMAALRSVRFDLTGTVTIALPQQVVDELKAKAGSNGSLLSTNLRVDLAVKGAVQKPDRLDAMIQAKLGGLTVKTEVIAADGSIYYRDPTSGKWEVLTHHPATGSHQGKAPLSYQAVLDSAKSLTQVGGPPSTLDGVSVDHYRIVPDLITLFAQVTAGGSGSSSQATAAIQRLLLGVKLTADVWTGTSDHLIRRLTYDATATADLPELAVALAGKSTPNGPAISVPAGSIAHLSAHAAINLHDFNAPVSIKAPTVAP